MRFTMYMILTWSRRFSAMLFGALFVASGIPASAEQIVVSGKQRVADAALLDGEFGGWNFGASRLLEAGFMGGIYAEHRAVSLIRFDVSRVSIPTDASAIVRLYKPKSFTQTADVDVCLYEVSPANSRWQEGKGLCEQKSASSSWDCLLKQSPWTGSEGLGTADVDYLSKKLAQQTAPADQGLWMEFEISIDIVRRWATTPDSNAGLVVRLDKAATKWGEHVYFHSSENELGRGPQLLIRSGEQAKQADAKRVIPDSPPKALGSGPHFDRWRKSNRRLARFAQTNRLNKQQASFLFHMDTAFRGQIVSKYEAPLNDLLQDMKSRLERGETAGLRASLEEVRRLLLVWEYLRETEWYTSGTLADLLSPLQLGSFYGETIFGRMEESAQEENKKIWEPLSGKELERKVRSTVKDTHRHLQIPADKAKAVDQVVADCERREHEALGEFRTAFADVQARVAAKDNSEEMLQGVKKSFLSHERFLYYQSIYNTPRWTAFIEGATPDSLAKWVVDVREEMYRRRVPQQMKLFKEYGVSLDK